MTATDAREIITILAADFRRTPPVLCWSTKTTKGRAYPLSKRIVIGPRCWRGIEHSLLHEMAHILTEPGHYHDGFFYCTLVAVVQTYFTDTRRYAWATEYRKIQRWARRDGFLAPLEKE